MLGTKGPTGTAKTLQHWQSGKENPSVALKGETQGILGLKYTDGGGKVSREKRGGGGREQGKPEQILRLGQVQYEAAAG